MIRKLGGRKLLLGVAVIALGVIIDATFGLSTNLLQLITFISVGFFLGNGLEHTAKAIGEKRKPKPEEDPVNINLLQSHQILKQDIDSLNNRMDNISEAAGKLEGNLEMSNKALSSIIDMLRAGGR